MPCLLRLSALPAKLLPIARYRVAYTIWKPKVMNNTAFNLIALTAKVNKIFACCLEILNICSILFSKKRNSSKDQFPTNTFLIIYVVS